jgi:hypothetical protein
MNENLLAFYMGYAFCHAVNVQHALGSEELMVPFVVYWQDKQPSPVAYPAATQSEAVAKACAARVQMGAETTGWSSCREGLVPQNDGSKLDALLVEGWVPGLAPPLELLVYYRRGRFRLIRGLLWKSHPYARKDTHAFMAEFKKGILGHPFGATCLEYIERAEPIQFEQR